MGQLSGPKPLQDANSHLHVWNNGFTIGEDGPLKCYDDPQNATVLECILRGKFVGTTHHTDYKGKGAKEVNPFSRSIKERKFIFVLGLKKWDTAEDSLCDLIGGREHWHKHPVIFLHLRRRVLMDLIGLENWADALEYFENSIEIPFNKIADVGAYNADSDYIRKEINDFKLCLDRRGRDEHKLDNDAKLTDFMFDYIRLHMPSKLGSKNQMGFWRFATEIPKKHAVSRKKSYRCLACSDHDMDGESIGKLHIHLKRCPMMISPFLKDLLAKVEGPAASVASQGLAADSNASKSGPVVPPPPTSHYYHEKMLTLLAEVKGTVSSAGNSISDDVRASLGQSFDSMESLANEWFSGPGSASMPRTSSSEVLAPGSRSLSRATSPSKAHTSASSLALAADPVFVLPSILARSRRRSKPGSSSTEEPSVSQSSVMSALRQSVQPTSHEVVDSAGPNSASAMKN